MVSMFNYRERALISLRNSRSKLLEEIIEINDSLIEVNYARKNMIASKVLKEKKYKEIDVLKFAEEHLVDKYEENQREFKKLALLALLRVSDCSDSKDVVLFDIYFFKKYYYKKYNGLEEMNYFLEELVDNLYAEIDKLE